MKIGTYEKGVYGRTSDGLWVRAVPEVGEIVVSCQLRHTVAGTRVSVVGPDMEDLGSSSGLRLKFGETWVEVGRISLDRAEILLLCEIGDLHLLQAGIARHVVAAIVGGWGKTVEEVVSWYLKPEECLWAFCATYDLAVQEGPYEGMTDVRVTIHEVDYETKKASGVLRLDVEEFPIELDGARKLGELLLYFGLSA